MSPLPMSRTAVDKLGKRLAPVEDVSDVGPRPPARGPHGLPGGPRETQTRLRRLGYNPTSRTMTTSVLIDKLRREHSSLKSVQDIAGTRIICAKERREGPSHGYRAVPSANPPAHSAAPAWA